MKTLNKDITSIEKGIILHQVNCKGKMASGVAKAIRNKWPLVYYEYLDWVLESEKLGIPLLGSILPVNVAEDLYVINLFGQDRYGNDGKQYTSYEALESCMKYLKDYIEEEGLWLLDIYHPLIGCALGGGKWDVVGPLIEKHFPDTYLCLINQ